MHFGEGTKMPWDSGRGSIHFKKYIPEIRVHFASEMPHACNPLVVTMM